MTSLLQEKYLSEVIIPYARRAMEGLDIEALEQADLLFWKEHDEVIYLRILSTYEKKT